MSFEKFVETFKGTIEMHPDKKIEFLAKEYKRNISEIDAKEKKEKEERDPEITALIDSVKRVYPDEESE